MLGYLALRKIQKKKKTDQVSIAARRQQRLEKFQFECNFIKYIQNKPQLYSKEYTNARNGLSIENAWQEAAVSFHMEVAQVQSIWRNLRDQYFAHKRKLKARHTTASLRPKFRHEDALSFLDDDPKFDNSDHTLLEIETNDQLKPEIISIAIPETLSIDPIDEQSWSAHEKLQDRNYEQENLMDEDWMGSIQKITCNYNGEAIKDQEKDKLENVDELEENLFVKTLVPKLKRIHSANNIKFTQVQLGIYQLLLKAEMEISGSN